MCRILILTFVDEMLLGVWWMKRYNLYYLENSSQEKVKFQLAVSPLFLKDGKRLLAGKNGIGNGFEISTVSYAYLDGLLKNLHEVLQHVLVLTLFPTACGRGNS